jgi:ABC-type transporter Mla maintaining outer membrane lipid asymmetry permease subunit MlaE
VAKESTVFWDETPGTIVEVYRSFGVTYCNYLQDQSKEIKKEAGEVLSDMPFTFCMCVSTQQSPFHWPHIIHNYWPVGVRSIILTTFWRQGLHQG